MALPEVIRLEIPSSAEFVIVARKAVDGIAPRLSLSDQQAEDVKLAVGEACTNAVKFGNPQASAVSILYRITPERLEIEIENEGEDFSPKGAPTQLPQDTLPDGGMGLYLIEQVMDELDIQFHDGKVVVRMVKQLKG